MTDLLADPYELEERLDTPSAWLNHHRGWRKEYDFTRMREDVIAKHCPLYPGNETVYLKHCSTCERCVAGYTFLCIKCGNISSYAGANILDMLCKECFDAINRGEIRRPRRKE